MKTETKAGIFHSISGLNFISLKPAFKININLRARSRRQRVRGRSQEPAVRAMSQCQPSGIRSQVHEIRGKEQVRGVGAINARPGVRGGNFNQGHYLNCVITARWRYLKAPNSIKLNKQGEKKDCCIQLGLKV